MNINDDMPCFGGVPIDVRVSRGRLRCVPPYSDNELEFTQIEGEFTGVSKIKWHDFPYWCVCLHDGVNEYHVLFFLKSAMFIYLVKCLVGRKVRWLKITVGTLDDGSVQMIVEGDNRPLRPQQIDLPPTRRYRKNKDNEHDYKDSSKRLEYLQKLVDGMVQPTRAHEGEGC